ncbi:MAG: hypothetical protein JWO10_1578 [Microbacteriaceae bacterium]|nr:hypothetical protein [Microbacteriaceae bacterium]
MTVVRRWQIGLLLLGLALLAVGGVVLLQEVSPKRYLGILLWFAGALIIHDGIIAPLVFLASVVMRKTAARVPAVVIAIVQGALVIGGIITLIVLPEIVKKSLGTLSSSILPQDYALHLGVFWVVLIVLAGLAVAFYLAMFARRQKLRPSADQA